MNKILSLGLASAVVLGAMSAPLPAAARTDAQVSINVGPPPLRNEARPAPRRGYEWTPGYWDYRGKRHVWVPGAWVRERPGYAYAQPQWVNHNGRWILVRGHWNRGMRDRDGDGVPNRYDARPNNPNWR